MYALSWKNYYRKCLFFFVFHYITTCTSKHPPVLSGVCSIIVLTLGCGYHSSGAVWESRWPSWAVRPNEPSGFRGRKAILNRASALVSACPWYVNRHPRTLSSTTYPCGYNICITWFALCKAEGKIQVGWLVFGWPCWQWLWQWGHVFCFQGCQNSVLSNAWISAFVSLGGMMPTGFWFHLRKLRFRFCCYWLVMVQQL